MADPTVVVPTPLPDPPPVNETQFPNKPCDPRAIHDRYQPIGTPTPRPKGATPTGIGGFVDF
jgi:hypothetical protein